ncbi:Metallocarboxypeptidase inhibitor (mitochondrion) [Melia azedarach]|nr:Metallocarboxypeptidase inhibitor [Melia azedarach]
MINGSSRRDLLLNSQNFCRSIPAGAENPSLSRLCYRRLWGSRNRRALILGWAYYLDAFSSYPLRTWLPSVYRGHDNWYTRGRSSFSWEYSMGYFSAVAPGTRTLAGGIFSTPSYPEKAGAPCVLEPITIFRLT